MSSNGRGVYGVLIPLLLFLASVFGLGGCACEEVVAIPVPPFAGVAACKPRHAAGSIAPTLEPASKTTVPGAIEGSFSVSNTGEASYTARLDLVPGYGGPSEPQVAITYDSGCGDGVLGLGFSLAGPPSAITRCPKHLALDGEIREVRYSLVFGIEVNAVLFAIRVGVGALDGLRDDSPTASDALAGATSAANPMGSLLESIASTYRNAVDGDYPSAAETGAPLFATLVAGVVAGKVAAAPEGAAAAAAIEGRAGLAAAAADGEVWNATGGVDFAKSSKLYPVGPGEKNIVRIQYTGSRRADYAAANKAASLPRNPEGYT